MAKKANKVGQPTVSKPTTKTKKKEKIVGPSNAELQLQISTIELRLAKLINLLKSSKSLKGL